MFYSQTLRCLIAFVILTPALVKAQDSRVLKDLEYANRDGVSLKLDLYLPSHQEMPAPAIVFVHGGGWKNGSKASAKKNAAWLTDHGFAVASIDYRLTDVAGWPAQINDCYEAVCWVRRNAAKYRLDAERVGCMGTSAGGHLAILMGTRDATDAEQQSSRVQAVCDWFGPSELMTMPPNNIGNGRTAEDVAESNGAKLLRATVREVPELARDASGIDHVTDDDPPFLIMHGDKDSGVPLEQSLRLHKRLKMAGVSSQLSVVKGAGHGGKLFHTAEAHAAVLAFFDRTLKPNWSQGSGPHGDFRVRSGPAATDWSVVRDENIAWKQTLPETGQSTVTVWQDRLFLSYMEPVDADASLGQNIVAVCMDASTGKLLWKRSINATHPLRLSGCFSDSSAPPAATDGRHVVFFNASGHIACFDMNGNPVWDKALMAVGRSQPMVHNGAVIFTRQKYMPDEHGHFTHDHKDAPIEMWTQLVALEIASGKELWTSKCGVNMGCVPMKHQLADGREVIFVGRGGGHSPPERPEGVSMISAADGSTIWTLPLEKFMSTMTFNLHGDHLLVFHRDEHLWVNVNTGEIQRRVGFVNDISTRLREGDRWATKTVAPGKPSKSRSIIQSSNLLVGDYHYFRSYTLPYLGRVHAVTGKVEQLQLPVDIRRGPTSADDRLLWDASGMDTAMVDKIRKASKKPSKPLPITQWAFAPNDMKNSRGFEVMGDARSRGTGWGHHASQVPTVVAGKMYIPIMNGTVYVIDWNAQALTEDAILGINDLGPDGTSYNRASLSYASGRLYAHTIRELICIEADD